MADHAHIKTKCGDLDITMIYNVGMFMSYEQIAKKVGCSVDDIEIDMRLMWGDGVSQFTVYTEEPMVSLPVVIEYLAAKVSASLTS